MCAECGRIPHHPRCPNAPDPEEIPVYVCSKCGRDIVDGEDAWLLFDYCFCEQCVDKSRKIARAVL